jgi:hypothetical protein
VGWESRKRWADNHLRAARRILHNHLGRGRIKVASWEQDAGQATDLVMERPGHRPLTIAWRVRAAMYLCYQDVTVRVTSAVRNCETELSKLKRGAVRYYLCLWVDGDTGAVAHYVLWNVRKAARAGLFDRQRLTVQNEGYAASSFVAIPFQELRSAGAVIAEG